MENLYMELTGAGIILSACYAIAFLLALAVSAIIADCYRATFYDRACRLILAPLAYAFLATFGATLTLAVLTVAFYR